MDTNAPNALEELITAQLELDEYKEGIDGATLLRVSQLLERVASMLRADGYKELD